MTPRELATRISKAIDAKNTEFLHRTGHHIPATYQVVFPIIEPLVREVCEDRDHFQAMLKIAVDHIIASGPLPAALAKEGTGDE